MTIQQFEEKVLSEFIDREDCEDELERTNPRVKFTISKSSRNDQMTMGNQINVSQYDNYDRGSRYNRRKGDYGGRKPSYGGCRGRYNNNDKCGYNRPGKGGRDSRSRPRGGNYNNDKGSRGQ